MREIILLFVLLSSSVVIPATAAAPCKDVRFEDGSAGRYRETKAGLSRCDYRVDMVHVAGPGRPAVRVTKATPDACTVEILEKGMDAARVVKAHSACVDASHAAAEKEVSSKR